MANTNWKTTQKSIGVMFMDAKNPRIPPTPQPLSEPELIAELVLHDDVYQLASNIRSAHDRNLRLQIWLLMRANELLTL